MENKGSLIYTKKGDEGTTRTLNGKTLRKNDLSIEVNGAIDEAIVSVEEARFHVRAMEESGSYIDDNQQSITYDYLKGHTKQLTKIIEALYFLGAEISNGKASELPRTIDKGFVEKLEEKIDSFNIELTSFVHFNDLSAIVVNKARVTVRRLERVMTELMRMEVIRPVLYQYVNRLSDYLFSLAYVIEKEGDVNE